MIFQSSLAEAIDCLKADTVVKDALGGHIYSNFVEAKNSNGQRIVHKSHNGN